MIEELILPYRRLQALDPSNKLLGYIIVKNDTIELNQRKKFEFTGKFCSEAEDPKKISEFKTWEEYCQFVQSTLYKNYLSALKRAFDEVVQRN